MVPALAAPTASPGPIARPAAARTVLRVVITAPLEAVAPARRALTTAPREAAGENLEGEAAAHGAAVAVVRMVGVTPAAIADPHVYFCIAFTAPEVRGRVLLTKGSQQHLRFSFVPRANLPRSSFHLREMQD